jgi:hypothetical protein
MAAFEDDNYDHFTTTITVDSHQMWQLSVWAQQKGHAMMANLANFDDIVATLNTLKLGWAGATAEEADDMKRRFIMVMQHLVGTQDDPDQGALNKVMKAVNLAAQNYANAEKSVVDMFNKFGTDLDPNSPKKDHPPRQDSKAPPITETFG